MVKSFLEKDSHMASRRKPEPTRNQDIQVATEKGLQYVILPPGTLLHKGADQCFEKDERPGLNPVWFSSAKVAAKYTGKWWIERGVYQGQVCTYRTLKPLRLLLINKNNVRRLYDLAKQEITNFWLSSHDPSYIRMHTNTIFPHTLQRETYLRKMLAYTASIVGLTYGLSKGALSRNPTYSHAPFFLATAAGASYMFESVLPQVWEVLKQSASRFYDRIRDSTFDPPGRNSTYLEDSEYSRDFCEKYSLISETLQLDGYYSPEIPEGETVDNRGLHEELMLCKPFEGQKLKLISRVRFGHDRPEGERRNFIGSVNTLEQHQKELAARTRAAYWSTRRAPSRTSRVAGNT
jgi:hypothetical protein